MTVDATLFTASILPTSSGVAKLALALGLLSSVLSTLSLHL